MKKERKQRKRRRKEMALEKLSHLSFSLSLTHPAFSTPPQRVLSLSHSLSISRNPQTRTGEKRPHRKSKKERHSEVESLFLCKCQVLGKGQVQKTKTKGGENSVVFVALDR